MTRAEFVDLFTEDKPVIFAFQGYQRAVHEIVHGHLDVDRIHVRGFNQRAGHHDNPVPDGRVERDESFPPGGGGNSARAAP